MSASNSRNAAGAPVVRSVSKVAKKVPETRTVRPGIFRGVVESVAFINRVRTVQKALSAAGVLKRRAALLGIRRESFLEVAVTRVFFIIFMRERHILHLCLGHANGYGVWALAKPKDRAPLNVQIQIFGEKSFDTD